MYTGLFRNRYRLYGKNWLASIPPEDRLVFSRLGHTAIRERGIPLQSLGGQARVGNRCTACGQFTSTQHLHICRKETTWNLE